VLLSSDIAAFAKMGRDEMRDLTRRLRSGASPQSLGIGWTPNPAPELFNRLRLALFDLDAGYPVDEVAQLTGVDRRWAEMMIALRLETHDPRVPDALSRLAAAWTVPALEEVAASATTPPQLREQLIRSIGTLRKA
jgi:hypothetical protein